MEYNGGSVVAMIGKDCVAIASDLRLGQQQVGVASNFDKVSQRKCQRNSADQVGLPCQRQAILWSTRSCIRYIHTVSYLWLKRLVDRADQIGENTFDSESTCTE